MPLLRTMLIAVLAALCAAPFAFAEPKGEGPIALDPARPAIGEWVGGVSWNDRVSYAWSIYPDGTFTSGRLGRGQNGGGTWSATGARVSLKYDDGFRYEGEISADSYGGAAYRADGQEFGTFSMNRARKMASPPDEAP